MSHQLNTERETEYSWANRANWTNQQWDMYQLGVFPDDMELHPDHPDRDLDDEDWARRHLYPDDSDYWVDEDWADYFNATAGDR